MGRKAIDLTGQRFGYLIVLRRDISKEGKKPYWICQCDCGNIISVRSDHLRNKKIKSCGCLTKMNLIGQKFGYLTVVKIDSSKIGNGTYWICKCDCGNTVSVLGSSLKNGNTKSCGCLQKEQTSKQNLIDLTNQKFGYLTVLKRDISKKKDYVYWICRCDCGNTVSIQGKHLKEGSAISCGCYNSSKGEEKIKEILNKLNINFIQQKTFNDLKYKSNLKFDFFLPKYNYCIEYNGIQHYEPVKYFGGEKSFEEQKKKDSIKREWCKENNIKLIEIPYTDFNKLNADYIKSRL